MLNRVDRPKGWNPVSEQYDVYSWTSLDAITVLTRLGISSVSPVSTFLFRTRHLAKKTDWKQNQESGQPLLGAVYFALWVFQEVDYLACFHPFHCCTSRQPDWKAKWTAVAQLSPVLSLLLALLYVCSSDLRKGTNSKHLYKAEIEWDLLSRPQSSGGSYSESEAYTVLEELAAILATFRPQLLIPVKRTKKPLNLHHLTPLEVSELILPQDRPLVRRMKVPQNWYHLPSLGVVGCVLPIEF